MFGLNYALREIIHCTANYCCFCFKQIEDEDKYCKIQDEVFVGTSCVEVSEILSIVLGVRMLDNLATDTICRQCIDLAIKCYNFINMCKHNTKLLDNGVTALLNYNIENIQDHHSSTALFLVTNGDKIDEYYDTRICKQKQSALLKRLRRLINKSEGSTYNFTVDLEIEHDNIEYNESINKVDKRLKSVNLSDIIHDSNNLCDLKCKSCLKVYPTVWSLKQHYLRVHAPKNFKCTECSRSFGTTFLLEHHRKQSHRTVMCSQCGKTYTNTYSLRHHERSHRSKFICHTCGKAYKGKQSLNKHIQLQLCQKMRKSNSEATFICEYCPKKYSTKTSLNVHIRVEHADGRSLVCQWCDKKFGSTSRLKDHIIKHTKQKNFTCDVCNGQFATKTSLLYHSRIHTGERPYQCDHCDMRFLSSSRRAEHVRRHHTAPSMECDVCHSKFKGQAGLLRHKKKCCDINRFFGCGEMINNEIIS